MNVKRNESNNILLCVHIHFKIKNGTFKDLTRPNPGSTIIFRSRNKNGKNAEGTLTFVRGIQWTLTKTRKFRKEKNKIKYISGQKILCLP